MFLKIWKKLNNYLRDSLFKKLKAKIDVIILSRFNMFNNGYRSNNTFR